MKFLFSAHRVRKEGLHVARVIMLSVFRVFVHKNIRPLATVIVDV